jgi:ATP-dependent helicase HepA
MKIKIGQRWHSKTEVDLGLGIILSIEDRLAQVYYPQKNETRTYNIKSSPLKRFTLKIGDEITDDTLNSYIITDIIEEDNLYIYKHTNGEIPESKINAHINLTNPEDKLFSGLIDSNKENLFRYETNLIIRKTESLKYRGFYSSKVGLIPHQLSILSTVIHNDIKKFILCDEVGLGKTIESLNIMKHLIETDLIKSALILTPQSLQYQWFIELFRKYNILFKTFGIDDMVELDTSFDNDNYIISSAKHLQNNQADLEFIDKLSFDLIIIDEAHQIDYTTNKFIEEKIKSSKYTMLLSATPEALGKDSFKTQCEVLKDNKDEEIVYFRNRREVLEKHYSLFPEKELIKLPITDNIKSDTQALKAKAEKILNYLDQDKTLIITHSKQQAKKIKTIIEEIKNLKIALFHSEMELMERDRQVAYFQDHDGANLCICTEVGSEGRNFEFAKKLILMDIAPNPTHLIQRIGRLDRIGQKNNFQIIIPYVVDSFEENLMNFYDSIEIFQKYPKGISLYYERIKEELQNALKDNDHEKIKILAKNYEFFREDQTVSYSEVDKISYNEEKENLILNEVKSLNIDIKDYLNRFCDLINLEMEDLNDEVFTIRATQNMSVTLPGLSFDGKMYTLNRELALIRNDVSLISIEDPLIKNIIEFVSQTEFGNTTVSKGPNKGIELIFTTHIQNSDINYKSIFPLMPLRVFLSLQGADQTKQIPKKLIDSSIQDITEEEKHYLAENLPKENIISLIQSAKIIAKKKLEIYIDKLQIEDQEKLKYIRENINLQTDSLRLII